MSRINDTDRLLLQREVDVLLLVCSFSWNKLIWSVECERLLAEEEDTQTPKADIVKQPNGDAYTSNPML
jgi:hypothetical protein